MDERDPTEAVIPTYRRLVRAATLTVGVVGVLVLLLDVAAPLLSDRPGSMPLRLASATVVVAALIARTVDVETAVRTGRRRWVLQLLPLVVAIVMASVTPVLGQDASVTLVLLLAVNMAGFITTARIARATLAVLVVAEVAGVGVSASPDLRWAVASVVVAAAMLWTARAVVTMASGAILRQRDAIAEVERVAAAREDFIATVSHELRTPIHVTTGFADTLDERWEVLSVDERTDLLARMRASSERLRSLVDRLLDFGRLRDADAELVPSIVEVGGIVTRVVAAARTEHSGHLIVLDAPTRVTALGDPLLVERVVDNLVDNACNHTPPGTTVSVAARVRGPDVEVRVVDDGPGIHEQDIPRLSERFYRGGHHLRRDAGGVGLGLAVCDEVLRRHGRELRVDSRVGRGASFGFSLPRAVPPTLVDVAAGSVVHRVELPSPHDGAHDGTSIVAG